MKEKLNKISMLCSLAALLFLCCGCGLKKEVLLEHSGYELELSDTGSNESELAQVEKTTEIATENSSEDATVIEGQIKDTIYVYICGQVMSPGVYQVSEDTRTFTVIELAGGLTEQAEETSVNQAQTLVDGQMIYIPSKGEQVDEARLSNASLDSSASSHTQSGIVNINTADLETLMSLPGIGEGKAQSILAYRQEHGSFQSIEEIMNVDGIKEGIYTKLKDKITI